MTAIKLAKRIKKNQSTKREYYNRCKLHYLCPRSLENQAKFLNQKAERGNRDSFLELLNLQAIPRSRPKEKELEKPRVSRMVRYLHNLVWDSSRIKHLHGHKYKGVESILTSLNNLQTLVSNKSEQQKCSALTKRDWNCRTWIFHLPHNISSIICMI